MKVAGKRRQFSKELERIIRDLKEKRPSLYLHSCCGPCSSAILDYLGPFFDITVFFDNPNIVPEAEFDKRLAYQEKVIAHLSRDYGIKLEVGTYDVDRFNQAVVGYTHLGEGSERCFHCYAFRLRAAAEAAKAAGADYFASTLSISPYKNAEKINEIGEQIAEEVGISHLPNDFKKGGGYQKSIQFCKAEDIYRQSYCGCPYSYREWQDRLAAKEAQVGLAEQAEED
ncbi:epoxyqueuosine reductase QueH [Peptococcus simiae]|uniref:epoxyqueuosine reductase QueH n=1 Tax=Peptococcus simiae TaxID=1643805 RepID=UPI003980E5C9